MSRDRLALVTMNKNKLKEIAPVFKKYNIEFETASIEKHEIRSDSVAEIARTAARAAFDTLQQPVVVDDTGFFVTSLNGFPGAYAAFVLKSIGYEGILVLMKGKKNRASEFRTAVGFCDGAHLKTFEGLMSGSLANEPAGNGGFGYDPIFVPDGYTKTYAELSFEEKVSISHRTRAFEEFLKWYTSRSDKP
ncbi:MAG: XTP/dITP diphosphatase [Promethearchaeota archaeon]